MDTLNAHDTSLQNQPYLNDESKGRLGVPPRRQHMPVLPAPGDFWAWEPDGLAAQLRPLACSDTNVT